MERLRSEIDITKYKYNLNKIKNHLAKNTKLILVIKADAYNHGSVALAKAATTYGIDFFAVATLDEAIELRKAGITAKILILGPSAIRDALKIEKYNLIQTVTTHSYAKALSENIKRSLNVHINIDTGMSRLGLDEDIVSQVTKIKALNNIYVKGIYTHFYSATNKEITYKQFNLFSDIITKLKNKGITFDMVHTANSAATMLYKDMHLDAVRVGLAQYGYDITNTLSLKPIKELNARIQQVKEINKGECVGYECTYKAPTNIKIATIAIGYADGYSRSFSNNDYFIYKGIKCPVIGNVSMDMTMIDVTNVKGKIKTFDSVLVYGANKPIKYMSDQIDSIRYEVLFVGSNRVINTYLP